MMNAMKCLIPAILLVACADVDDVEPSNMPETVEVFASAIDGWDIDGPAIARRQGEGQDVAFYRIEGAAKLSQPGYCDVSDTGWSFKCGEHFVYCPVPKIGKTLGLRIGITAPEATLSTEDGYLVCSYHLAGKEFWLRKESE